MFGRVEGTGIVGRWGDADLTTVTVWMTLVYDIHVEDNSSAVETKKMDPPGTHITLLQINRVGGECTSLPVS